MIDCFKLDKMKSKVCTLSQLTFVVFCVWDLRIIVFYYSRRTRSPWCRWWWYWRPLHSWQQLQQRDRPAPDPAPTDRGREKAGLLHPPVCQLPAAVHLHGVREALHHHLQHEATPERPLGQRTSHLSILRKRLHPQARLGGEKWEPKKAISGENEKEKKETAGMRLDQCSCLFTLVITA